MSRYLNLDKKQYQSQFVPEPLELLASQTEMVQQKHNKAIGEGLLAQTNLAKVLAPGSQTHDRSIELTNKYSTRLNNIIDKYKNNPLDPLFLTELSSVNKDLYTDPKVLNLIEDRELFDKSLQDKRGKDSANTGIWNRKNFNPDGSIRQVGTNEMATDYNLRPRGMYQESEGKQLGVKKGSIEERVLSGDSGVTPSILSDGTKIYSYRDEKTGQTESIKASDLIAPVYNITDQYFNSPDASAENYSQWHDRGRVIDERYKLLQSNTLESEKLFKAYSDRFKEFGINFKNKSQITSKDILAEIIMSEQKDKFTYNKYTTQGGGRHMSINSGGADNENTNNGLDLQTTSLGVTGVDADIDSIYPGASLLSNKRLDLASFNKLPPAEKAKLKKEAGISDQTPASKIIPSIQKLNELTKSKFINKLYLEDSDYKKYADDFKKQNNRMPNSEETFSFIKTKADNIIRQLGYTAIEPSDDSRQNFANKMLSKDGNVIGGLAGSKVFINNEEFNTNTQEGIDNIFDKLKLSSLFSPKESDIKKLHSILSTARYQPVSNKGGGVWRVSVGDNVLSIKPADNISNITKAQSDLTVDALKNKNTISKPYIQHFDDGTNLSQVTITRKNQDGSINYIDIPYSKENIDKIKSLNGNQNEINKLFDQISKSNPNAIYDGFGLSEKAKKNVESNKAVGIQFKNKDQEESNKYKEPQQTQSFN